MGDQDRFSPYKKQYNLNQTGDENKEKFKILRISSWSSTKFSGLAS